MSISNIDSVHRTDESYNPQVLFEECNYIVNKTKMSNYITDDINIYFDYSKEETSDYSDYSFFALISSCP